MSILRRVERELDERLRRLFASAPEGGQTREALEIQRAILNDVTGRVQPVGRGRRVFPFRHLEIHIGAPQPGERSLFGLVFAEGDQLASDIRGALRESGCEPPADLGVEVVVQEAEIPGGFQIVYHERPAGVEPAPPPAARLVIVQGQAEKAEYALGAVRVNVGRLGEVLDDQQRLVRRNQVVFTEGADAAAQTVSRAHAHIRYDTEHREYRIYDDHSAYGTSIFREGALLAVPPGAGRGLGLHSGDEIYFGQARARFELH